MTVFETLLYSYLLLGLLYSSYVTLKKPKELLWLPLNILVGPVIALFIFYKAVVKNEIITSGA